MTASPSETAALEDLGVRAASVVGGTAEVAFGTVKVRVPAERWREALRAARDELGLVFFSWLSAVDWTNDVAVGDPPSSEVAERYEVLATLGDISEGRLVVFSTDIPKETPVIDSVVEVFRGADWHEREAHEMFGIEFTGHPGLTHLYLPNGFEGHPLRKSFPLLAREVKPWPGTVDVEGMPGDDSPSEENPEA